ncbi:hypothetical protein HDV57DRAFT_511322 [Trichoderma longibrachiatum]
MVSRPTIHELTIADLRLTEDDEDFADGVACVRKYWSQASQMTAESQEVMIQIIINRGYVHNNWSRKHLSRHRLYRTSSERDDASAWPVFLILNALYKKLSSLYLAAIRERNLPTALEDHTDDYLAVFPNTVLPTRYDTRTPEGEAYRRAWPRLRNTPTIYRKRERATPTSTALTAPSVVTTRRSSSTLSSLSSMSSPLLIDLLSDTPFNIVDAARHGHHVNDISRSNRSPPSFPGVAADAGPYDF